LNTLKVIIVDDEALARQRLRQLLTQCIDPAALVVGEAADAISAMQAFKHPCDLVLLDIHLPGMNGLKLAHLLHEQTHPPLVVFVTAHAEYAVQAFDLAALDYLTKPVRLDRLQVALKKTERQLQIEQAQESFSDTKHQFILIQDRGRSERVPLTEILYLKAELKYITVRTRDRTLIADGSLSEFEHRHGTHWLRIHRNALVARHAIRALLRQHDHDEGEWAVRLEGVSEVLAVSRRQLPLVREALAQG
jgi:two-component system response regulator AlgR